MTTTPDPLSEMLDGLERFVKKAAAYEHPLERVEIATSELAALVAIAKSARTAASELNLAQSLSEGNGKSGDEHDHAATEGNDPMMCYWCLVEHQINKAVDALTALDALTPEPATKETER